MIVVELAGVEATWNGWQWESAEPDLAANLNGLMSRDFSPGDAFLEYKNMVGTDVLAFQAIEFLKPKLIKNEPVRIKEQNVVY